MSLDTVKKILRGLVVSVASPIGVPLISIRRDYMELEGRPLPFADFGFRNELEFLLSLRDCIRVYSNGGVYYAQPVISQDNAHVSQLVREQNRSRKTRFACGSLVRSASVPARRNRGGYNRPVFNIKNRSHIASSTVKRPPAQVWNPHTNRFEVASTTPTPTSSQTSVQSISNTRMPQTTGPTVIPSQSTQIRKHEPVTSMPVERNKPKMFAQPTKSASIANEAQPVQRNNSEIHTEVFRSESVVVTHIQKQDAPQLLPVKTLKASTGSLPKFNSKTAALTAALLKNTQPSVTQHVMGKKISVQNRIEQILNEKVEPIEPKCTQLDVNNASKITVSESNQSQTTSTKNESPQERVFRIQSEVNTVTKYGCSVENQSVLDETDANPLPSPILRPSLLSSFVSRFKLNYETSDFGKLRLPKSTASAKSDICSKKDQYDSCSEVDSCVKDALPDLDENHPVFYTNRYGAVPLNAKYIKGKIPSSATPGSIFRLRVSEINNPYKFWFHFEEYADSLDDLLASMQTFYNQNQNANNSLYFKDENLKKQQICVASCNGKWSRAVIINVYKSSNTAKVFYVDSGITGNVLFKNMRLLINDFFHLPTQAFRGCLDYITPISGLWSRRCILQLIEMVKNISIYGCVSFINEETAIIYMKLSDTSCMDDLDIAGQLREYEYAETVKNSMKDWPIMPYSVLYPTFDMLENGQYPSFEEVCDFMEKGFDFELYEESSIVEEMFGYSSV